MSFVSEITYYVSSGSGTLNSTHSLIRDVATVVTATIAAVLH